MKELAIIKSLGVKDIIFPPEEDYKNIFGSKGIQGQLIYDHVRTNTTIPSFLVIRRKREKDLHILAGFDDYSLPPFYLLPGVLSSRKIQRHLRKHNISLKNVSLYFYNI